MQLSWLIVDTHPIQYRAPVFAALHRLRSDVKILFRRNCFDGRKWWFHEFNKTSSQEPGPDLTRGYTNEVMSEERLGPLAFYIEFKKLLKNRKPKGVVIYGWYLPQHWIIWWLCMRMSIPLVFVGETFSLGKSAFRKMIKKILHPIFFSQVSQVISIGSKNTEFYEGLHLPKEKITEAKYCVDTTFFAPTKNKSALRPQLEIPENAFVLLFVGRIFERKRPWDMIKIHRSLLDLNVYTLIAGAGPLLGELKHQAHGIPRMRVLGQRTQEQVRELYQTSQLLVVPSEYETWGLVINEAFSCGVPALVSDTCGAANDLVVPNKTGGVYPVGNIEKAAAIIRNWILNPDQFKELQENSRTKVNSQYGVDQFAGAIDKAFKSVELRG